MSYLDIDDGRASRCTTSSSIRTSRWRDVIKPSSQPNLWVAPSRIALAKLEARLVGELDSHFKLKDRLAAVLGRLRRRWSSTARRRWGC